MNKLYQAIREGLSSQPVMRDGDVHPLNYVTDQHRDAYSSLYFYNEEQKKRIEEKNSVAGIRETVTNRLFFDLDAPQILGNDKKYDLTQAKADAFSLAKRLFDKGFEADQILVYFSGNKGFSVEVMTDTYMNPEQFKRAVFSLAGDLKTFDKVINDANRIIRIPNTRHPSSGLYKIQLSLEELEFDSIEDILVKAKKPRNTLKVEVYPEPANMPSELDKIILEEPKKTKTPTIATSDKFYIDWTKKPAQWRNCKWALLQGHFEPGQRHEALMRLGATHRGMGFDKITNYYMCKSALKKQAELYGQEEFDKGELWLNIIEQSVHSDTWNGGAYSCKTDPWLKAYCTKLGAHACPSDNHLTVKTGEVFSFFENYAQNFDKNALTTGIGPLDAHCRFMVGTSNGLLAPPGVGKTSLSLQILKHNSKNKIRSIFFSYDMFHAALLMRMIQEETGLPQNIIFEIWKSNDQRKKDIQKKLEDSYKYVDFCFKAGQSVDEMEETIDEVETKTGEKVKLIIVDYNELISSDKSDDTAASAQNAQRLRKLANEKSVCSITLLQPSKVYSSPADEITNYNAAKGASSITQSMTLMLGCARPGFNPLDSSDDNYFSITCLKNRNGALFSIDLGWSGLRGAFSALTDEQRERLKQVRSARDEVKTGGTAGWK